MQTSFDDTAPPALDEHDRLVKAAATGDEASWERLLKLHSGRLSRMLTLRMDGRMSRRVDVDDVLQDVYLQASQHLASYLRTPGAPFYLWLRGVAANVLLELHRRHLSTQMRDARRELPLPGGPPLDASSQVLAWHLADSATSPSNAAMKAERQLRLQQVIDRLPVGDKEVLALRHFEQLTPSETAQVLQISEKAAGMRYVRALKRLRDELAAGPGGLSEWRL